MPIKLKNIKTQEELDAAIKKHTDEVVKKETEGLKKKNAEIIAKGNKASKLTEERDELQEKLKKAEDERDELAQSIKDDKGNEYKGLYEKSVIKVTELEKQIKDNKEEYQGKINTIDIRTKATEILAPLGLDPVTQNVAITLATEGAVIIDDDNIAVGGVMFEDHLKGWAESDVGKRFIVAPDNTGGGADNNQDGDKKDDWEKYFDPEKSRDLTKQAELYRSDRDKYDELYKKYNSPE